MTTFPLTTFSGSPLDDIYTGGSENNQIFGQAGNDVLNGGGGNDTIFGDEGNDWLSGGSGNDTLVGGAGSDVLAGGDGDDVYGVDNSDTIDETGTGRDTVLSSTYSWQLGSHLEDLVLVENSSADVGIGNSLNNRILGNRGSNALYGINGNDVLVGAGGNDVLEGGTGSDRFDFLDPAIDGVDQIIDFTVIDDTIGIVLDFTGTGSAFANAGLTPNATLTVEQFHQGGTALNRGTRFIYNPITGSLWFDIDGTGATPQVQLATLSTGLQLTHRDFFAFTGTPASGNPLPPPDDSRPKLRIGTRGNDRLEGGSGNDKLLGLEGHDILVGKDGSDRIEGGDGADRIYGGTGNNKLIGGRGRDIFALEPGAGRSLILDFGDRSDRLGISRTVDWRNLTISQQGQHTRISLGSDLLAILYRVHPYQIAIADFVQI
ncbi:MAG: calcium-binding protein [Oculatellaceae cyanobacterium bins.114]|nr:calcium-binding protein [Oculatellaceae cyanobacterium bins.114]